jgi:hypothetical protein
VRVLPSVRVGLEKCVLRLSFVHDTAKDEAGEVIAALDRVL